LAYWKKASLLLLVILTSLSIVIVIVIASPPTWVREGQYLVYDIVVSDTYLGINKSAPYATYFNNITVWGRIRVDITGFNETHLFLKAYFTHTNDTSGRYFASGSSQEILVKWDQKLENKTFLYIKPSELPPNGIHVIEKKGFDKNGNRYSIRIETKYDLDNGLMLRSSSEYIYEMPISGTNITYIDRVRIVLVETNIEGLETYSSLAPLLTETPSSSTPTTSSAGNEQPSQPASSISSKTTTIQESWLGNNMIYVVACIMVAVFIVITILLLRKRG